MAEEYEVRLTADNEISDEARDAAEQLDKIPDKVNVKIDAQSNADDAARDLDSVFKLVDKLGSSSARIVLQDNAKSIQGEIADLLITLDQLDANDPTVQVKIDQINELEGQLGSIETKVAELGNRQIDINTGSAKSNIDDLGKSADSSKSVLANMVGNSVQDLGALGGVAGSVGVAIGQMGEYMVDAANDGDRLGTVFKNFATVAGPIAAITVVISALSSVLSAQQERTEAAAARVDSLGAAMQAAGDDTVGLTGALRDNVGALQDFDADASTALGGFVEGVAQAVKAVPVLGGLVGDAGQNISDVASTLDRAGVSFYDFAAAIERGGVDVFALQEQVRLAADAGKITSEEYHAAAQAIEAYGDSAQQAASIQKLFNVGVDEANALLQDTIAKADPLSQMSDVWRTLFEDMADGTIDTKAAADAINLLSESLGLTQEEVIGLAQEDLAGKLEESGEAAEEAAAKHRGLVDALAAANAGFNRARDAAGLMSTALERFNAGSDLDFSAMAADTVESFDSIKTALGEVQELGSKPLVPTAASDLRGLSDESAAVIDSLGGMRNAIQTELVAAMDAGGGSFASFSEKAGFFRDQVLTQFPAYFEGLGLSSEEAAGKTQEVLSALGLLPEQVSTQIKLEGEELARQKIELFGGAIDDLPADVQTKVVAAIDANDPVTAWQLIKDGVAAQGDVPVNVGIGENAVPGELDAIAQGDYATTVDLEANPKPAEDAADEFVDAKRTTTPVDIDASSVLAAGIMLAFLTARRQATIDVVANTLPAALAIANIVSARPTAKVDVAAGTVTMPSASDLARRIGTVTVPVNLVVGQSIRITGVRD